MQDKLKFNGKTVAQPDDYSPNLATTSTDDSERDMFLTMHNTPIGTVESYSLKWTWLTPKQMSEILTEVLNKKSFTAHYFDIITGKWRDGEFYASNFSAPAMSLKDGEEMWDELSFNMIGIRGR